MIYSIWMIGNIYRCVLLNEVALVNVLGDFSLHVVFTSDTTGKWHWYLRISVYGVDWNNNKNGGRRSFVCQIPYATPRKGQPPSHLRHCCSYGVCLRPFSTAE